MLEEKMKSSNDIQSLMTNSFPYCPICKSKANFSIVNEKKPIMKCQACEAEWILLFTPEKDEIFILKLKKLDRKKRVKSLQGLKKTLGFWQFCKIDEYSGSIEKTIKKRLQNYGEINFKKIHEKAYKELIDLGDYSLFNSLGLIAGSYSSLYHNNFIQSSLNLINEFSDDRTLPDLIRIFKSTLNDRYRYSIIISIRKISSQNGMGGEIISFLENTVNTDQYPIVRSTALVGLIEYVGYSGKKDMLPFIFEKILGEKDVDARANSLFALPVIKNDPRIIDFMITALDDDSIPNLNIDFPTSWEDVAITALELLGKLSIGEMAANTLIEIGNKKGILAVVDNFIENGFNPFHMTKKRTNLLIKRFPYIMDHLVEIKSNGNEEQRVKASGILSIISDQTMDEISVFLDG